MEINSLIGKTVRLKKHLIKLNKEEGYEYLDIPCALRNFIDDYHNWTGKIVMDVYGAEPTFGSKKVIDTDKKPVHLVIFDVNEYPFYYPFLWDAEYFEVIE